MKGAVWYKNERRGIEQIEKIKDDYKKINIEVEREYKSTRTREIYFSNGDIWRMIPATEMLKGVKVNVSYIENEVDYDFISYIIRPCTIAPPYHAECYYS